MTYDQKNKLVTTWDNIVFIIYKFVTIIIHIITSIYFLTPTSDLENHSPMISAIKASCYTIITIQSFYFLFYSWILFKIKRTGVQYAIRGHKCQHILKIIKKIEYILLALLMIFDIVIIITWIEKLKYENEVMILFRVSAPILCGFILVWSMILKCLCIKKVTFEELGDGYYVIDDGECFVCFGEPHLDDPFMIKECGHTIHHSCTKNDFSYCHHEIYEAYDAEDKKKLDTKIIV